MSGDSFWCHSCGHSKKLACLSSHKNSTDRDMCNSCFARLSKVIAKSESKKQKEHAVSTKRIREHLDQYILIVTRGGTIK